MISLLKKFAYLDVVLPVSLCMDYIMLSLPSYDIKLLDPLVEEVIKMLGGKMQRVLEQKCSPEGMYFIDNNMPFIFYFLGILIPNELTNLKCFFNSKQEVEG